VEFCRGTSPRKAANSLPLLKFEATAATESKTVAAVKPIPGICITYQAGGQIGEKADHAGARQGTSHHRLAFAVHAVHGKTVLCQVDADGGNTLHGMASCKVFLNVPMHTRFRRAGPSHHFAFETLRSS
jgi:hypothetical protein